MKSHILYIAVSLLLVLSAACSFTCQPAWAGDRPANFVFLVDVSGSMLYKNTMVTASNGTKIFLFEALRLALKQIVADPRVLGANSKACVITFGTDITEKRDWPQEVETEEKRQKLVQLIQSPDALQADKHGDTYMGGALAAALDKANRFYAVSDPCTSTYVIMLTDGWDEPPPHKTGLIKLKDSAAKYVARVKEIQGKLGVRTWYSLVIGLQNLPDQKAGTTTAKELASMLDGQFIDVTKQAGGTVSEKIFHSLKQTVENLRGELKYQTTGTSGSVKDGVLQFGTIDSSGVANATFPLTSHSCYSEDVYAIRDVTSRLSDNAKKQLVAKMPTDPVYQLISALPADAINLKLETFPTTIAPHVEADGARQMVTAPLVLVAEVHSICPAGHFVGAFTLESTAKLKGAVPFSISVPGRLVSTHEKISLLIKKPGVFWAQPTSGTLENSMRELSGAHSHAIYKITVTPESANLVTGAAREPKDRAVPRIDSKQINDGKPFTFDLDTTQNEQQLMRLNVAIPANQVPGRYAGKLGIAVTGATDIVAPADIDYEIVVEASPWEKVAPIAIPVFLILGLVLVLWFFFWLKTQRRG